MSHFGALANVSRWSIHAPYIAILSSPSLPLGHSCSPISLLHSFASPPLLFSATWCVYRPSIHCRFSVLHLRCFIHVGVVAVTTQLPTPSMNIPRPLMPCTLLHASYLFSRFLGFIYHSSSHLISIGLPSIRLPQTYSTISLFPRHIFLRLFIPSLPNPVLSNVHVPEHIIHPVYSSHPVLMCTLLQRGLQVTIVVILQSLRS